MRRQSKMIAFLLALFMVIQSLGISAKPVAAAEDEQQPSSSPIKANALFGTTVRAGSYADTPAATGSSSIPREIIEAKWAGDMSFSRRGLMEFDIPANLDWDRVTSIKLTMYLSQHTGNGKKDTLQVFKTDKPSISEENWTWNNTNSLMDTAEVIGEQTFTDVHTGSWVEIDVTNLKDLMQHDPDAPFALALFPKAKDDQGGIRFYSQHQEGGKYTPYLNIYQSEYIDTLAPTVQVTGLTDGQQATEEDLSFTIQVTDNADPNPAIHLTVNGKQQTAVNGTNTVKLTPGQNVIRISAMDESGNVSEVKQYTVEYTKSYLIKAAGDTYTDKRYPNTNYNNSTDKGGLQLKNPVSGDTTRKVYLSFDLPKLPYVKEAGIELYLYERMGTDKTSEIVNIYEVSDFDETTLTWGNAPANGEKVADTAYDRTSDKTYVRLDITEFINKKLASGAPAGRINFVLQVENGHDQKGAYFSSKDRFPDQASRLVLLEGLPAPVLEVDGIEDQAVYTNDGIQDVSVLARSVSETINVDIEVTVNGAEVVSKGNHLYDIPLQIGTNTIRITATDEAGNKSERTYTVVRLQSAAAGVYYVDSVSGDDANDGLSEKTPWKSLDKLNATLFQPGSKILFKRGGVWNGQFRPNGSGKAEAPIIVDAYGAGTSKPIINGGGISNLDTGNAFAEGAVHLYNVSFWELNNLEVTNKGPEVANASRAGIMVAAGGNGFIEHVYVKDVYVHDVNSHDDAQKISGGIIFRGDTVDEKGNITNVSSGFKDILVEKSHIKDVAIEGLRTKTYKNGGDTGSIKNEDVVFRNNLIENILGDGIVISEMASGGLVEKNIVRRHSMSPKSRNYAGLWLYQTDRVVVQYNEVYAGVNGYNDGEAFDFDIGATNNVYQYNYSHDNRGGFLLTMTSAGAGNVFRYNISKNDGRGTEIFFCMNDRTAIYNNTIYVGEGVKVLYLIKETNIQNMFFKNNIVHVEGSIDNYSQMTQSYNAPNVSNNLFYPASIASLPGSPNLYPTLVTGHAELVSPDAESIVMDTWTQQIWDANIANFKLKADSPAIDAGAVIPNAGDHDIYGTPLYEGSAPDIGAHEFASYVEVDEVLLSDSKLTLNVNETYPLSATILPANATNKAVDWSSSNEEVVQVDAYGLVTAKAAGTATITVTTADGNKTATSAITVVDPGEGSSDQLATTLTGPASVQQGKTFSVKFGLSHVKQNVLAQLIQLNYDADLFEFVGAASLIDGIEILEPEQKKAGELKLIMASLGVGNAIKEDADIIEVTFKAKELGEAVTGVISVVDAKLGDEQGRDITAALSSHRIELLVDKPAIPGDFNGDGKVSIGDLAMIAAHYGKDDKSPDWDTVKKYDMNNDDKIDVVDLADMAKLIFG